MTKPILKVGRIDYLNIWPVFEIIKNDPVDDQVEFLAGHPSLLNRGLADGTLDVSPSSSFEYLARAEQYRLFTGLGISARDEVRSVLFCLPFPFMELEDYVARGGVINLTNASAASTALLKVLWRFFWKLPPPVWSQARPGQSLNQGSPFLEIGDHALNIHLIPGSGLEIIDLAAEWNKFTGLPFVFALWIVRMNLSQDKLNILERLGKAITSAVQEFPRKRDELAEIYPEKRFKPEMIKEYWEKMDYSLGPEHLASLALFGHYLTRMDMIPGMPVLDFI